MASVTILLVVVVLLICYYLYYNRRLAYMVRKIPGPPGLPFLGNTLDFLVPEAELWNYQRKINDEYYPINKITTPRFVVVNLRHPDDVEILLSSQKHITKSAVYDFLQPWFQTGLLTSTGNKWQNRRKILTPAFHFNVLREFAKIFDEEGRRMVHDLKEVGGNVEYDLISLVTKYTLNTICETAMGTSLNESTTFHKKYRNAIYEMGEYMLYRLLRPWIHPEFIFNLTSTGRKHNKALETIHSFSKRIISERQQYHDETGGVFLKEGEALTSRSKSKKRMAMLDLLIASMKEGDIDEPGIREEVDTFMFEGHDTSGAGMAFTLLLLAEHKDAQQRARAEIDAVLQKSGGKMEINDVQQFTYLDLCIKEALRLFPSVPFISRVVTGELQLKNYTIPDGVITHVHIWDTHRDPNFWPDPHTFDPDRFLPDRIVGRHPFSYVPFSAGPRNCIGQKFAMLELKAMIGHLLHNFNIETNVEVSKVQILPHLVLKPEGPMYVKFIPR